MTSKKRFDIGIISTVNNFDLYKRTLVFFPENFKTFVIDGCQIL